AERAVLRLGFPVVMKPLAGLRSAATYKAHSLGQVRKRFDAVLDVSRRGVLIERFIDGNEYSCEVILHDGRLMWYSISYYRPNPLDAVGNASGHFSVMLPAERSSHFARRAAILAAKAVRALGLRTGLCHVEWFQTNSGKLVIGEAAVRPPSASIPALVE